MHYVRSMEGATLAEQMNPSFRKVSFDDEPPIVTISTLLCDAWISLPPEVPSTQKLGTWMTTYSKKTSDEKAATPFAEDDNVHTTWRDLIYEMFNHVFYDVYQFLSEACMLEGEFVPPSQEAFALRYPGDSSSSSDAGAIMDRSWDVAVFLIPAYVAPDVTVQAFRLQDRYGDYGEEGKELDHFNAFSRSGHEIWYILPGTNVRFVVKQDAAKGRTIGGSTAAVMVAGLFTPGQVPEADHPKPWLGLAGSSQDEQLPSSES
jgi:hypothetical protein